MTRNSKLLLLKLNPKLLCIRDKDHAGSFNTPHRVARRVDSLEMTSDTTKRKPRKIFFCFFAILLLGWRTFRLFRDVELKIADPSGRLDTVQVEIKRAPELNGWKSDVHILNNGSTVLPPRFILGIMTHDMVKREEERRELIRSTYLSYFRDHGTPEEYHRICSVHEIVHGIVLFDNCQVAYTFVMGSLLSDFPADNRTELLSAPTTKEMTRPHPEPDVLLLDIKENGEYGKSPTWFRYATLLMQEQNLPVDYIIKTDSDTLILPTYFLSWVDEQESKVDYQRSHVYGGMPIDKKGCGWPSHEDCQYLVAPYFHGGGLYFASADVARYIVSDQCPRSSLFLHHEDVAMANYVYSMTNMTGQPIVSFVNRAAYLSTWRHPVKSPNRMLSLWRKYEMKQK